jgi:hypothetical protein
MMLFSLELTHGVTPEARSGWARVGSAAEAIS